MNHIASSARRVWKTAQIYFGLHRDPNEQESFIMLNSTEGGSDLDIQIRRRPDIIVSRRDFKDAWDCIIINEHAAMVKMVRALIRVNHDGSVTREGGKSTKRVEADGGILNKTELVEPAMSSDRIEFERRTPDNLAAITSTGLLSKDR